MLLYVPGTWLRLSALAALTGTPEHTLRSYVAGGMDALFDDGSEDRIGIQGAGRSEKARHWQRFMDWGGPEKAKRRHLRVLYLEFERGNHAPIMEEWWS